MSQKALRKRLKNTTSLVVRGLVMIFCFALTVAILGSSYETAFSRDLPHFDALRTVSMGPLDARARAVATDQNDMGGYGRPKDLKVPSLNNRITMAPYALDRSNYVARANIAHYIIETPPLANSLGTAIVYLRSSWRTVNDPTLLKAGDNIFIDTDKAWRYLYRIDAVQVMTADDGVVSPDDGRSKLLLVFDAGNSQAQAVISATQVSVQSVGN